MTAESSTVPKAEQSDEVSVAGVNTVEESASKAVPEAVEHDTTEEDMARKRKIRTWLVKSPKPLDVSAPASVDHLVAELNSYKHRAKLLGESADVIKISRNHARDNLRKASDLLKDTWKQIKEKEAIAKPLREERDKTRNSKSQFKQRFEGLQARTAAELDQKVKELEHCQMHDTLSIREEKEVIKQIKALKSQRGLLVEYEAENKQQQHSKESLDKIFAELKELDAEINALYQEKEVQDKIVENYREEERALNADVEKILDERKRMRALQDNVWGQLREEERKAKAATEPYYAGRRFAVNVRNILQAGRVDEAREMCDRQVDEVMAKLSEDDEFRKQYLHGWSLVRCAAAEDEVDNAPQTSATPSKLSKEEKEEQNRKKAASLIAAALQHAQEEVQERRAAVERKAGQQAQQPASSKGVATGSVSSAPVPEAAATPSALPEKPKPKGKSKKVPKAAVVELPKLDETPFVPPPAAAKSTLALSSEELREREREHNKAAALEAAQRKERRKQAAVRKRQQKAQHKEQQAASAAAEEVAAPETPPAEEDGFKVDHYPDTAAATLEAVAEEAPKLRARTVKARGPKSSLGKTPAQAPPKPRPFVRKRSFWGTVRSYGQTVYSTYEEHPLVVGGVSAVLGLLAVAAPAVYLFA